MTSGAVRQGGSDCHVLQALAAAVRRRKDHDRERQAQRPRQSDHPFHRRRRHRPRHLARRRSACSMPRSRRPTAASARSPGMEVYAGEKAFNKFGNWLPDETVEAFREYLVGIKGPLTTPVGGGIRSLNVALRQMLDLYVCLRPVRWFKGVPSPVQAIRTKVDMVIFRENTEDIYAGIECEAGTAEAQEGARLPRRRRFPKDCTRRSASAREHASAVGIGIKPVTRAGHRAPRARARSSTRSSNKRKSVTLVHKGNIMKFTEGAFRDWGYAVAAQEFGDARRTSTDEAAGDEVTERQDAASGKILIKDAIADITLQQVLTRPRGVRRHRHAQPQRRLPLRRAGGAGRRHRHRARRQHQLRHRPRHLRGHARHRAEVRRTSTRSTRARSSSPAR